MYKYMQLLAHVYVYDCDVLVHGSLVFDIGTAF